MSCENHDPRSEYVATPEELEALIARYTLEYLYRWTNNFAPAELAEFRKLLDRAGPPADLLRMLRASHFPSPTFLA
ncbi:MAG TPA: hypothetical protein VLV49_08000 [Terriglobales bacterium]|nr:hypothetical protein [Terriglobales bacterium]